MIAYRVVNVRRLGQGAQRQYITTDDFRGYVTQANSSIKTVADIARSKDLTEEERRTVDSEVGKVAGYTIPMAEIPKGAAPTVIEPSGPPVALVAAAALLAGGLAGYFIL